MPATLKSLTSKVNKLAIKIDDEPAAITVWYTTRKLTPKRQREINRLIKKVAEGEADEMDSAIEQMLVLVTRWDLKADETDTDSVPLTKEALEDVSLEVLGDILDQIMAAMSPKAPTDGSSNTP